MSKSILQKKRILTKASGGSSISTPVSVANGGTGISSYSIGDLLYASGVTTLSKLPIGTALQQLRVNAGATSLEYFTPASSGITVGTTTITSGTSTRVPFNDSGVYGEDADFTWDKTNNILTIGSSTGSSSATNSGINIGGTRTIRYDYANSNLTFGQIYSSTGVQNIFIDPYKFYSVGAINSQNSVIIGAKVAEQGVGNQSVCIGGSSTAASAYSICIGYGNYYGAGSVFGHRVIALGAEISNEADATAQGFLGGSTANGYISNWFFNGRISSAPYSVTLNACGGSGSNIAGAAFTIAGGKGTGTGAGGDIILQTSTAGGSGATLQTLSEVFRIKSIQTALLTSGVTTGTGATAGFQQLYNSLTTGNGIDASSTSLSSGNLVNITSTSTAAASNTSKLLNIARSGANATASQTVYGQYTSVTNTGTTNTNIAGYFTATGAATNNIAIQSIGKVVIGSTIESPYGTSNLCIDGGINMLQLAGQSRIRFFMGAGNEAQFLIINSGLNIEDSGSNPIRFTINTSEKWRISSAGSWSNTAGNGTAYIHLKAGTATASTAPLKFTSGTNLTTAENGAFEYNGTNLFFTRTGAVREGVITQSAVTTEVVVSDTTVTVNIGGVTYKLLAKA